MTTLLSEKVDFRIKNTTTGKERNYIMIKGSIHKEDNNLTSICFM